MAAGTAQESRLAIVIDTRDAEARIRRLREQLRELGGAADDTTDDTNRLDRANNNLNGSTSRLNKTMAIASKAFKYGSAALVGVAVAAVKVSGDFEEAMNGVKAVSGATGESFDQMRELAKKMGSETAFSATEAANGMEFLAMAGLNTEQIMKTIPNALNLAAAGNIGLAESADILSNIMTGMGVSADESERVADVLAATAAAANVDVKMLGESMKYAAPIAKQLGISLEDTAASMGILGNAGIQGGEAGTALRAIYTRLATHKKSKEWFDSLGLSVTDASGNMKGMVTIIKELQDASQDLSAQDKLSMYKDTVGTEAMSALGVTIDSITDGSLDRLIEKLDSAEGSAKRMADIRMEGFNGAIKGAKSAAEGFLIAIGDSGLLDLAAGAVTGLANGIRGLTERLPTATADITAFFQSAEVATALEMAVEGLKSVWGNLVSVIQATADVIAPVIDFFREHDKLSEALAISIGLVGGAFIIYNAAVIVGTAATAAFGAALAFVTAPITLIIIGLTALVAAGVYVYRNWDMLKAKALEVFGGLPDTVQDMGRSIADVFNSIVDVVSTVFGFIGNLFSGSFEQYKAIISGQMQIIISLFKVPFQLIGLVVSAAFKGIITIVSGAFALISNGISTALKVIKAIITGDFQAIPKIMGDGLKKAWSIVGSMVNDILNIFINSSKRLYNIGKDFIQGFVNGIKSSVGGVIGAVGGVVTNAINMAKKTQDSNSPSKVTTKLGGDFGQGFANGIKGKTKVVKTEAQKMAEGAVKAVQDGVASLKREIALFGNDSALAALDYDIKVGKFGGANTGELRSLTQQKEQLELSKKLADANKSVQDSIDGLIKQQALFGNNSSLASLMYDIEHTEKYKGVTQELTDKLIEQTRALEQLGMTAKATDAIRARFAKLKTDQEASGKAVDGVMGELQAETAIGKIQADYERRIEVIRKHEELTTGLIGSEEAKRIAIYESAQKAKELIQIQGNEKLFGELSSITKTFFGEQSAAHRAMFAVEKYFALKRILVENKVALAKAWASAAFPYNLPAVATVAAQTGLLAAAVKGFKQGGYTGNMGVNQVAGAVHGQEYVFDAQSTKRIGVDNLNAMRSGRAANDETNVNVTVNNHTSAKVETQTDSNGNIIMTIRDEIKKSWTNTGNPNSFESKQLNRNLNTSRRR